MHCITCQLCARLICRSPPFQSTLIWCSLRLCGVTVHRRHLSSSSRSTLVDCPAEHSCNNHPPQHKTSYDDEYTVSAQPVLNTALPTEIWKAQDVSDAPEIAGLRRWAPNTSSACSHSVLHGFRFALHHFPRCGFVALHAHATPFVSLQMHIRIYDWAPSPLHYNCTAALCTTTFLFRTTRRSSPLGSQHVAKLLCLLASVQLLYRYSILGPVEDDCRFIRLYRVTDC